MLNQEGFDAWASGYEESVARSAQAETYPFAGYERVLDTIAQIVMQKNGARVLDLGFGTGELTQRLYRAGHTIYGVDFSQEMVRIAAQKMPNAHLFCHDFSVGLPAALHSQTFDFILSTYAIHHLDDTQKNIFLAQMRNFLVPDGKILLGDVAFASLAEREACRAACAQSWDSDEFYPVLELIAPAHPGASFTQCSFCAGVLIL